ncbi:MAG TPA: RHS repeat-associated core domain-containing protein, partial [Hydrogenophaga sp.]|nr:RHS repeat-associated core domain-containing protein [Hydrogenophaga sp.]
MDCVKECHILSNEYHVLQCIRFGAGYDPTGRLLQLQAQGSVPALQGQQTYTYDANGNRMDTGLQPDVQSNRLLQAQSQPVVINAAGEITWQTGQALRYDAGGRLHHIKACTSSSDNACATSEDGATRHWYNGQHQRVLREDPTGQTVYVYGTDGHNVLGEYRQASTASAVQRTEHIYLPTASGPMPVAAVISGQHYAVHSDHLNTPRRLTDSARRVRWQWAYSGYGETQAQSLAVGSLATVPYHLRYPGQVDDGNGLFYNWHRFYHPGSGRYVSADPIGLEGGFNRFTYVGGNPLSGIDPRGLDCVTANGFTSCTYPGGPSFRIPAQPGFPDRLIGWNPLAHAYNVVQPLGQADLQCVLDKIRNNPTPGNPNPATPDGTSNNAVVPGITDSNWVTSYATTDLNTGGQVIVNVTGPRSRFGPGYVARVVTNGVVHT